MLGAFLFSRFEHHPRLLKPFLQQISHPLKLRMSAQKFLRLERPATGGAEARGEGHLLCHRRVYDFSIDGSAAMERYALPLTPRVRIQLEMSTKGSATGLGSTAIGIKMISLEFLSRPDIDLALIFLHQLFPPNAASD